MHTTIETAEHALGLHDELFHDADVNGWAPHSGRTDRRGLQNIGLLHLCEILSA